MKGGCAKTKNGPSLLDWRQLVQATSCLKKNDGQNFIELANFSLIYRRQVA